MRPLAHGRQRIGQGRRSDQVQNFVGTAVSGPSHLIRDLANVTEEVVGPLHRTNSSLSTVREVAATFAPCARAIAASSSPTDVVPPRIRSRSPLFRRSPRKSAPDAGKDLASPWHWKGPVLDLQRIRTAGRMKDCCFHRPPQSGC